MQTQIDHLKQILKEEADFNRSWTDGRRGGDPGQVTLEQRERRLSHAARLEGFVVEIEGLQAIESAARNLVKVKGRYHTEQAFKALAALLVNTEAKGPRSGPA
jgi:hypothetical protein